MLETITLDSLLKFGGSLLSGIKSISFTRTDKRKLGKAFGKLYIELSEVVINGKAIISMMEKSSKGKKLDFKKLSKLLYEQSIRINNINAIESSYRMKSILKIYLPKISDIKVLVEMKGERVALLYDSIKEYDQQRFHEVALDYPIPYYYREFVFPKKASLVKAKDVINKLNMITKQLRDFVVKNFDVNEII